MPQPRFDELRERLLRAGIAPRHVRRYVGELRDHFDDLVREDLSKAMSRDAAETAARTRLGSEGDLAGVMLARPALRSLTARYPWAVFGVGPVVLLIAGLVAAVAIEMQALHLATLLLPNPAHRLPPEGAMQIVAAWNGIATLVAPLGIAGLLCFMGARQRMPARWIFAGVVIACVLGGFQRLSFADNGYHGEMMLGSGLLPPFPRDLLAAGIWRALIDLALVGGAWWILLRRGSSPA
ncbi:MAG TPA: hypothetical protein VII49_14120 [Rhizomicrobium sp.]